MVYDVRLVLDTDVVVAAMRSPAAVRRLSKEERTSINQFVATAVAEKVSALETARFFQDRKARVQFKAFDRIMRRRGGKPPREGDELPA